MNILACKLCGSLADEESHASLGFKPIGAALDAEKMRNRAAGWICGACIGDVSGLAIVADDGAEAMLKTLGKRLGGPVMPIRRYCDALRTYETALVDRALRLRAELYPDINGTPLDDPEVHARALAALDLYRAERLETEARRAWIDERRLDQLETLYRYEAEADRVSCVFSQITRSNLLARLLYDGEPLRERPCPVHKGKWSGCTWPTKSEDCCSCMSGCNVTGWLPNEEKR